MAKPVREATKSVWMETTAVSRHQSFSRDTEADVCVVGAGIAGLTTAYQLACEGRKVVVLDDGPVAGGQTQRTSAHLSNAIDDRYVEIEKVHGEEGARLAAESHTAAIDRIEAIAQTAGVLVVHTLGSEVEGKLVYFMTIDNCRFRRPVVPGDQLRIHVKKVRNRGFVWKFSGAAKVDGILVAEATVSAVIMEE